MGPIWAICIWDNPYGIHGEPGCTSHMGILYGTNIRMFAGLLTQVTDAYKLVLVNPFL